MVIYSIYKFTNRLNGKVYIGKTKQPPVHRKLQHLSDARSGSPYYLHRAIRKHGEDAFEFEVIFNTFYESDLASFERHFIEEYNCCTMDGGGSGYNMTRGGDGFDSEQATMVANRRVAAGTHPWVRANYAAQRREHIDKMFASGTHPFQTYGPESTSARLKRAVEQGTNPFAGEQGSKLSIKVNARLMEAGVHIVQTWFTCPHCGKTGRGPMMRGVHFEYCTSNPTRDTSRDASIKLKGERISARRSREWIVTHPDGAEELVKNLHLFSAARGLNSASMYKVASGQQERAYKGFRVRPAV